LISIQLSGSGLKRQASQKRSFLGMIHPHSTTVTYVAENSPWIIFSLDYINYVTPY
jgi:hypothetical protein